MDAEHMSFDDESFDTVAISHSLHHFQHPSRVLHDMKRVLKLGGLFIIGEAVQDKRPDVENPQHDYHHWFAAVDRQHGLVHNDTFIWQQVAESAKKLELRGLEMFDYIEPDGNQEQRNRTASLDRKLDIYLEKLQDHPKHKSLWKKGLQLKEKLAHSDVASPPQLYILGWK
jgi:SAM-dependent methyltransferase